MAEIAQNADPIHFRDHVVTEIGQPAIAGFITARADKILGVVGHLHHTDTGVLENFDEPELVLERRDILETEDDSDFSLALGAANVFGSTGLDDQIAMSAKPPIPTSYVGHGGAKVLPTRTGTIGRRQPAPAHVLKHIRTPVGDDQAIDDNRVVMEFLFGHS